MTPLALIRMVNAFESLFPGIILGLVAGLSPGPMLALIIAETLKFGKEEGFKVAVSPMITDSTIVLLTLLALSTLAEQDLVIGLISIFGACYLIHICMHACFLFYGLLSCFRGLRLP